jgi:hypothetical protein
MSNYLAVATVTASLQRALQIAVQDDIEGARVTTMRPSDIGSGTPESGVNLFLYQVVTNPALQNIDTTPFRSRGNPTKRQVALDLYYMLSFYGNDVELEPQRLLGSVVRTLNDQRMIDTEIIRAACRDSTLPFLQASTLAEQVQQMNIVPLDLNLEDLSKAWSVFFQTPYLLSIAYKILVVMLEGEESPVRGLPIRDRRMNGVTPSFQQPHIERIGTLIGMQEPILADSSLVITGKDLKGDGETLVRLFEMNLVPTEISPTRLVLTLAQVPHELLRAGVQSLQVVHLMRLEEAERFRGKESNAIPFVLRPRLMEVQLLQLEVDEDLRSGELEVQSNIIIGARQRVTMIMNEWNAESPHSYLFDSPSRTIDDVTVRIPFKMVKPGDYLIRLMVDGAESQLQVDSDANSPTYDWYVGPKVLIT